jgi:putative two-component system response regulator
MGLAPRTPGARTPLVERRADPIAVLLVEDDEEDSVLTRDLVSRIEGTRHSVQWVSDYASALAAVQGAGYDVCLVDYRLGADDGIALVRELVGNGHPMPVILLTGHDDRAIDVRAAKAGAADFLVKGEINATMLERTIRYAIQAHAAARELQDSYRVTVRALAATLELRHDQTGAHAERVTELALRLSQRVAPELSTDQQLEYGFLLHDIGKIGVADAIVLKPGPLTPEECRLMQGHVTQGEQIIAAIPYLSGLARDVVAAHHERYDGGGYPRGLQGAQIPLAARIFAVVDAFDAMTNDRPYRRALPKQAVLHEIRCMAGTQFDPGVVDAFMALMAEQDSIHELHAA